MIEAVKARFLIIVLFLAVSDPDHGEIRTAAQGCEPGSRPVYRRDIKKNLAAALVGQLNHQHLPAGARTGGRCRASRWGRTQSATDDPRPRRSGRCAASAPARAWRPLRRAQTRR